MHRRVLGYIRRQPVAFVALFFALSGGAVAAGNVIHVGDPAGGDLTGTYPNPTIATGAVTTDKLADGAVTTSKFASGAQAPDSAKLAGADPTAYGAVLSGRVNALTTTNISQDFGAASGTSTASPTEANVSTLSPNTDLVARDLSVEVTAAPGGNFFRLFRLVVNGFNGSNTVLECQLGSGTTCSDSSHSVSVPAGSTISINDLLLCTSNCGSPPPTADARFAFRLTHS